MAAATKTRKEDEAEVKDALIDEDDDDILDKQPLRMFLVRYAPNGVDPSIKAGKHGQFSTYAAAEEAKEKCFNFFNRKTTADIGNQNGFEVELERRVIVKVVALVWIEEYVDGKRVRSEKSTCADEARKVKEGTTVLPGRGERQQSPGTAPLKV